MDLRAQDSGIEQLGARGSHPGCQSGTKRSLEGGCGPDVPSARGGRGAAYDREPSGIRKGDSDAMSDNPLDREQLQQQLLRSPFNAFLNLAVQSADLDRQELVVHLEMRPEFERIAGSGQWHG